jgi:predicted permease
MFGRLIYTIRYSARLLRKNAAFSLTAILTLALGIGANIAVFSVMNAVLVNPSGIPHPQGLVALRAKYAVGDLSNISMSAPDVSDAASGTNLLSSVAAMQPARLNFTPSGSTPIKLDAAKVTSPWFDVFQAKPLLGRSFRPEEDMPDANREVILTYASWQNRFGGDKNIVGRKLLLNEQWYEVVGVAGPDFNWPNNVEMWLPLGIKPERFHDPNYRYNENLFAVGRMRDGVTVDQVNAFLNTKASQVTASEGANSYSKSSGWGMFSMPLIEFVSGDLRKPLVVLIGAVALVLLIVCANIAGLQLARASGRQREVSIQIALGSSRSRLIEQALIESLLLAFIGALLGILLAKVAIPALLAVAPPSLGANLTVKMDTLVLAFVTVISILCAVLCGIAPAWQMTQVRWFQSLQEGGRSETVSKTRQHLRSALVVCEIAVAMLLLTGAGLLTRSLSRLERVDTGFESEHVMTGVVSLPAAKYKEDATQVAFLTSVEEQLRRQPGVTDVAIADCVPFVNMCGSASFGIVGRAQAPNDPGPHGYIRTVSPGYFSTLKIPVLQGRAFSSTDRSGTAEVAVIDNVLAHQYWPNENPVGQYLQLDTKHPKIEIVGVVAHARSSSLESDGNEGFYYLSLAQFPSPDASIAVRTNLSRAMTMAPVIQQAVREVDPNQPVYDLKTMQERVEDSLVGRRFLVVLLSIFAGLALMLSALGLYGVINYGVKLRVREIGIRMALGAQRLEVLRMILRQGLQIAAVGLVVGFIAVLVAGRALSSMLYQVTLFNPTTLLATSVVLAGTVLIATYLPARRAAQLDPMRTLRDE